jgi:hypothetical protein
MAEEKKEEVNESIVDLTKTNVAAALDLGIPITYTGKYNNNNILI